MTYIENNIKDEYLDVKDRVASQIEYIGNCHIIDKSYKKTECIIVCLDTKYAPKMKLYNLYTGKSKDFKCKTRLFNSKPFNIFDMIKIKEISNEPKKRREEYRDEDGNKKFKYVKTDETELWLTDYEIK